MDPVTGSAIATGLGTLVGELVPLIVQLANGGMTDAQAEEQSAASIAKFLTGQTEAAAADAKRLAGTIAKLDAIDAQAKPGEAMAPAPKLDITALVRALLTPLDKSGLLGDDGKPL